MSQPPTRQHEDHPDVIFRNARIGMVLFVIYFILYVAFILWNVFAPNVMGENLPMFGGPNLAIVTGVGLIFAAIALSLIYMKATHQR